MIFIGIPNVEFNESVLADSTVNLVIILPHNEWLMREWQYLSGLGGVFKPVAVFLSIPGNKVQCVVSYVIMESIIQPNVPRLLGCCASVM